MILSAFFLNVRIENFLCDSDFSVDLNICWI